MRTHSHTLLSSLSSLVLLGTLTFTASCAPGSSGTPSDGEPGAAPATSRAVDPAKIKGLKIVNDSSEHSSCRFSVSYPVVPGATAMTKVMKKVVETRLATFRSGVCEGGESADRQRELNVSHTFLVASGKVLGVRLTTRDHSAPGDGTMTSTYWYDGKAKAYRTAFALIGDRARNAFVAALKKQLKGREGIDASGLGATVLDDMAFTGDGGLRVDFDRGDVGVPAAGRTTVAFSKKRVAPWLSDFGRRAQEQAVQPGGGLDLGAGRKPAAAASATPAPPAPAPAPKHTAAKDDDTDCKRVKCLALTFDDGPAAPETATLLTHLARYKARATFFTVGQNVLAHPGLVRAEAKAGHEVGNHSWNHPDLTKLTPRQVAYQLNRTSKVVKSATGKAPTLFRPPYGALNTQVKAATKMSPALWDLDTEDWKYREPGRVARTVIAKARRNDVVLMHDIHPTSVAAVPEILRTLTARGYHFVTVSHLRASL